MAYKKPNNTPRHKRTNAPKTAAPKAPPAKKAAKPAPNKPLPGAAKTHKPNPRKAATVLGKKKTQKVPPHTRNGKPVKGHNRKNPVHSVPYHKLHKLPKHIARAERHRRHLKAADKIGEKIGTHIGTRMRNRIDHVREGAKFDYSRLQ